MHTQQLSFLHHILTLYYLYEQQKRYEYEQNLFNEIKHLPIVYKLRYSEEEISLLRKKVDGII